MNTIQTNLDKHGIQLPAPPKPGGSYTSVNVRGNIAYVSIQFPIKGDEYLYRGRLGLDILTDDGSKAAELCALNVLSQIDHYLGFDKVEGLNHLDIHFQQTDNWDEGPAVADGASNLFLALLGETRKTFAFYFWCASFAS